MQLSGGDVITIGSIVFTTAATTAGLTWFIAAQFTQTRKMMHELIDGMNVRVTRIELHLVKRDGYQPAIDPLQFNGGGRLSRR